MKLHLSIEFIIIIIINKSNIKINKTRTTLTKYGEHHPKAVVESLILDINLLTTYIYVSIRIIYYSNVGRYSNFTRNYSAMFFLQFDWSRFF